MKITEVEAQLISQLKDADCSKRHTAIMELLTTHPSPSQEDWEEIKDSPSSIKKRRSFFTLEPLVEILKNDPSINNRALAAIVLGDYGDSRAVEPLRKYLDERNHDLVISVIRALGKLKNQESVPRFLSFTDRFYGPWIRVEAIQALCELNHLPAQENFRELLGHPDDIVRREAMMGLVKLSQRRGEQIKADLKKVASQDSR